MTQPRALEAARLSVEQPLNDGGASIWTATPWATLGVVLDAIPPWGRDPNRRDQLLQAFLLEESVAGSAVATVAARNAAYDWEIRSDSPRLQAAAAEILRLADLGQGWEHFAMAVGLDYLSQDKGAFVELIRTRNDPGAPLVGIRHLAARQCWSTGDPEYPVVYRDREGKVHRLAWYQVYHLAEMPMAHPIYSDLQFSAVSRILRAGQIHRNIARYVEEKTAGRQVGALYFVSGVTAPEIQAALDRVQAQADNRGLSRFAGGPVIIPALSDQMKPQVATIELASVPDGFDQEEEFRQYLTVLALGLLVDFQELAPLPSGNIGTGQQSETLDQKSRQKGAALWRKAIAGMMRAILPPQVEFRYTEIDVDEAKRRAEVEKLRAEARQIMAETGEIDIEGARAMAVREGDVPADVAEEVADREEALGAAPQPAESEPDSNAEVKAAPVPAERLDLEGEVTAEMEDQLSRILRRLRRALREG